MSLGGEYIPLGGGDTLRGETGEPRSGDPVVGDRDRMVGERLSPTGDMDPPVGERLPPAGDSEPEGEVVLDWLGDEFSGSLMVLLTRYIRLSI